MWFLDFYKLHSKIQIKMADSILRRRSSAKAALRGQVMAVQTLRRRCSSATAATLLLLGCTAVRCAARWHTGTSSAAESICRIRSPGTGGLLLLLLSTTLPDPTPWRLRGGGVNNDNSKLGGDLEYSERLRVSGEQTDKQFHDLVAMRTRLLNEVILLNRKP